MNPFAGVNDATTSKSGNYLTDGRYELTINRCIWLDTDKKAFITEFTVTKSDNEKHPVGSERSFYQALNKSFKSEVKAFYLAAVGYDEKNDEHCKLIPSIEKKSEALMMKAVSHNVLKGRKLIVEAKTKPQKGDPEMVYTKHMWKPAEGASQLTAEQLDKAIALP